MTDIYDRSAWPPPESNPLVQMFERGDDWYSNKELNTALQPGSERQRRSVVSNWPTLRNQLADEDSMVSDRHFSQSTVVPQGGTGGLSRYWSRKALIIIAMRAQTINAAAFRDWLAHRLAKEVGHG